MLRSWYVRLEHKELTWTDSDIWESKTTPKLRTRSEGLIDLSPIFKETGSTFITCPCHRIYRVEAVGLKSSNYSLKVTIFVNISFLFNQFLVKYRCPFPILLFFNVKSLSITQRSVSQENASKTSKTPAFLRKTIGSNNSFTLIENDFRFLR